MRILYLINSLDGGGGALPLPHLVSVMRAAGHDVKVIALMERNGRAKSALDAAGIEHRLIGGAKRRYVSTALHLDRIVREHRPDLLWTSLTHATITGEIVGALRGIPVVSWLHNAWLKPVNIRVLRRTAPLTRHWVADSQTVARFGQEVLGIDPVRISVWPLFIADEARPCAQAWQQGSFRIASLGRLHRNKGYDVLIRAAALLNKEQARPGRAWSLHIAGEGAELAALNDLASSLGVTNVHFEGFCEDPQSLLASCHAYVQPSHHEGLCIAAHEAMVAGLPVIASPVGEMQHSVRASGAGQLVDFGDAQGLAEAFARLIARPEQAAASGQAAREWALNHYSAARFVAQGLETLAAAGR
jgi:glycosyltransferase involved in cell wall biosynthesis